MRVRDLHGFISDNSCVNVFILNDDDSIKDQLFFKKFTDAFSILDKYNNNFVDLDFKRGIEIRVRQLV